MKNNIQQHVTTTGTYKCCNKEKLSSCSIVIIGIKFPALICSNCGEVVCNFANGVQRFFFTLLEPFWIGKVLVDDYIAYLEQYE